MSEMKIWGLTGGIASGKSKVLLEFKKHGAFVLDLDEVARETVDPLSNVGQKTIEQIRQKFGAVVIHKDSRLDREKLRDMISQDPRVQRELEAIMHPVILTEVRLFIEKACEQGATLVVIEGTRLIESGFHQQLDGIIFVEAADSIRLQRTMERDHLTRGAAARMMSIQDPILMKKHSTFVIENSGDLDLISAQVENFYREKIAI